MNGGDGVGGGVGGDGVSGREQRQNQKTLFFVPHNSVSLNHRHTGAHAAAAASSGASGVRAARGGLVGGDDRARAAAASTAAATAAAAAEGGTGGARGSRGSGGRRRRRRRRQKPARRRGQRARQAAPGGGAAQRAARPAAAARVARGQLCGRPLHRGRLSGSHVLEEGVGQRVGGGDAGGGVEGEEAGEQGCAVGADLRHDALEVRSTPPSTPATWPASPAAPSTPGHSASVGVPRTRKMETSWPTCESPGKRGAPVAISASTQPADHTSTGVEYDAAPRRSSGRSVPQRHHVVGVGADGGGEGAGEPEVSELDDGRVCVAARPTPTHQHVLRLHVPVQHAVGVRVRQGGQQLERVRLDAGQGEPARRRRRRRRW